MYISRANMNQVLKSFGPPSLSLLVNSFKNTKTLSSINIGKILFHYTSLFTECKYIPDVLKQNSLLTQNADLLINNIKNASSVINVLELVNTHSKIMNSNHAVEALKTIFTLQKHDK